MEKVSEMDQDESREPIPAQIARRQLPRYATPSFGTSPDAVTPPAEPLLLPPANPADYREPCYDDQDIDGYTIAEAHAALAAFKRRRQNKN